MNNNPVVSVCVITYQHVDYIRKCLDGILSQKVNFLFEIVIGEDESRDGTRKICIDYANKFPDKIRLFLRDRNSEESKSVLPGRYNFVETLNSAKGQFIALCDGDDYWTDENKLQSQLDFLTNNPEYILVGANSKINENEVETNITVRDVGCDYEDISTIDLLSRNPFVNSMVMFKNIGFNNILEILKNFTVGDRPLFTMLSFKGKLRFYNQPMGYYRIHSGSATSSNRIVYSKHRDDLINRINYAIYWNEFSNNKFVHIKNKVLKRRARQISSLAIKNFDFKNAIHYSQFIDNSELKNNSSKIIVMILKKVQKFLS